MSDAQPNPLEEYAQQLDSVEQKLKQVHTAEQTLDLLKMQKDSELQKLVRQFEEAKAKIEKEKFELDSGINKVFQKQQILWQKKKAIEVKIQKQEEYELAHEANLILSQRWERMLMGVPWREWARDHQLDAAKQFAQQKRMILADTVGLGKTLSAIMGLDFIRAATDEASPENPYEAEQKTVTDYINGGTKLEYVNGVEKPSGIRALYIAPASLVSNVVEEFNKWAPHRQVVPINGIPKAQREFALSVAAKQDNLVVVINYESWRSDKKLLDALINLNFDTIIVDEMHNAKDTTTDVFQGINRIVKESMVPFIMPMTGTPILNSPVDLFSTLYLLFPDEFYSKAQYLREYCRPIGDGKWEFKYGGVERIASFLGKRYLRRTKKTAGIQLPPLTVETHSIEINLEKYTEQAKARQTMRDNAVLLLKEVDDEGDQKAITAAGRLAVYTRLRQIETWPAGIVIKDQFGNEIDRLDVKESQKLDYVLHEDGSEGLILDLLQEERVVIFSQFIGPLEELNRRLINAGKRPALLTGSTSVQERAKISHDFDVKFRDTPGHGKYDTILCHYRVGGVGLNFTEASQMIILDEEWNPGKREQAYGRIERMGQEKPMTVHVLHMEKTIDDWLSGIMTHKEGLVEGFEAKMAPSNQDFLTAIESGLL